MSEAFYEMDYRIETNIPGLVQHRIVWRLMTVEDEVVEPAQAGFFLWLQTEFAYSLLTGKRKDVAQNGQRLISG